MTDATEAIAELRLMLVAHRFSSGGFICYPSAITAILAHIDAQAAEIEALRVACRDAHTAEAEAMAVLTGCEERVGKQVADIMKLRERCLEQEQKHSDALWEIGHLRAQLNAASK